MPPLVDHDYFSIVFAAPTLYYYRRGQEVEDTGHGYRIGFSNTYVIQQPLQ